MATCFLPLPSLSLSSQGNIQLMLRPLPLPREQLHPQDLWLSNGYSALHRENMQQNSMFCIFALFPYTSLAHQAKLISDGLSNSCSAVVSPACFLQWSHLHPHIVHQVFTLPVQSSFSVLGKHNLFLYCWDKDKRIIHLISGFLFLIIKPNQ